MAKRRTRLRRMRREALVFQHLERVSRKLLDEHPDIVRQFIGRSAGVYALYRKSRLYYVGLAKGGLRNRLTAHGRNRHGKRWDHFSIYLTIKDQHLREIEALLLRITQPQGAKQSGKLAQSKDMKRQIMRAIREKQAKQISSPFADTASLTGMLMRTAWKATSCTTCRTVQNFEAYTKARFTGQRCDVMGPSDTITAS